MDKKELIKRATDPKYIPGIYNYCDRWCERCQFTSRCLNHSLEEDQNCQLEEIDEANERFWYSLKDSFKLAFSLIEDLAQEERIDLESIEIDEDEEIDNKVDILTHRSMNYANMVDEWFKKNQNIIEKELAPLSPQCWGENISNKKRSHLKLIKPQTTENSIALQKVIEVINYYQYAITVKLSRAIESRDNEVKIRLEDISKDSDGSAKIALIEIDCSINAWSELLKYFEAEKTSVLKIINYLKQIREIAEKEFPNARSFIRPGFDEVTQNG